MKTALVNFAGVPADKMQLLKLMMEEMGGRSILTRRECSVAAHRAAPKMNRTLACCPNWISHNAACAVLDEAGNVVRGLRDLSKFYLEEKAIKVKAPKESKLLAQVVAATEEMAKTVESEQLINEVLAATETPIVAELEAAESSEIPAEVPSDKKSKRAAKRAAKKAAAEQPAAE